MKVTNKNVYVHRYFAQEMNDKEKEQYNVWLQEDSENREIHDQIQEILAQPAAKPDVSFDKDAAFKRHLALLQAENNNDITPSNSSLDEVKSTLRVVEDKTKKSNIFTMRWFVAIASVMTLAIAALFLMNNEKVEKTFQASNESIVANLNDGSKIHLNQGTSLDVISSKTKRKVELKGEAFFNITPDASKPFEIKAGDAIVTVLGTEFMLSTIDKTLEVKEGSVNLSLDGQDFKVGPGQSLHFADKSQLKVEDKAFDESQLWFNEELTFNNAPFDKVITTIAKHFDVKINMPTGRDWQGCTFTANSLKNENLENILIILQLTYELQYSKISDKEYKISKVRCK